MVLTLPTGSVLIVLCSFEWPLSGGSSPPENVPNQLQGPHCCIHMREAVHLAFPSACLRRIPSRTCATKDSGPWELLATSGPSIFLFSRLETENLGACVIPEM